MLDLSSLYWDRILAWPLYQHDRHFQVTVVASKIRMEDMPIRGNRICVKVMESSGRWELQELASRKGDQRGFGYE